MSNITVTRLRENASHSRKTLTSPDPFTEVMHFRKRNTTFCSAIPFALSTIWKRKKLLFLVLKKVLDGPAPIRTLLPSAGHIYLVRERPCLWAAHLSNASAWQRQRLSPSYRQGTEAQRNSSIYFPRSSRAAYRRYDRPSVPPPLHCSFHLPQRALFQDCANATVNPKQLKERKISLFTILTFPACWCFSHVATKVKSSSLMPHSLPSSNEGERGDQEIPNMLVFIKIHELN